MRRILDFFRSWATAARVVRHILSLRRRLVRLERDTSRMKASFRQQQQALNELVEQLEVEAESLAEDIRKADALVKRYEESLESARSELRLAEDVIKTQAAALGKYQQQWKAEQAVQVRRQLPDRTEEER